MGDEYSPQQVPEPAFHEPHDLVAVLSQKVVGQPAAMNAIVPYIEMHKAHLAPEGRPLGIFLLLGPTGTGKTRTVEALAEVLHGSAKKVLKINCGEFQMDHEVAKLIGAPPGYLGHRETEPLLTHLRLSQATTLQCPLSLVLFDEIEKAAPSLTQLLLGVMDKAVLQLADGGIVNFEKSLIFLTSNLGAREMMKIMQPPLGFQKDAPREREELGGKLENIALGVVRKAFSPEFVNRVDAVITYHPLDESSLAAILQQHISELQAHVNTRLGSRCFQIEVTDEARQFLLSRGTSAEYGARELKRTIHRHLTQPLASRVARNQIQPGSCVRVAADGANEGLVLQTCESKVTAPARKPRVLLVDDNRDLLGFLRQLLAQEGWEVLAAQSAQEAREIFRSKLPDAALLDYALPDGNGVELGIELKTRNVSVGVVLMTGASISDEEEAIAGAFSFPVLRKPFLGSEVVNVIRSRFSVVGAAGA